MQSNISKQKQTNYIVVFLETVFSCFTSHFSLSPKTVFTKPSKGVKISPRHLWERVEFLMSFANYRIRVRGKKAAFTLAEVLITLGIVGVVAALTLPSFVANYKNRLIAKQLQKTYSTLSQAISMAQAEYGDISQWPIQDGKWESIDTIFKNYLKPHLNIVKECRNSKECFSASGGALQFYTFILSDGTQVLLDIWNHQENTDDLFWSYGVMSASKHFVYNQFLALTVDVNGDKKPNKSGEDIFVFILAKNGLIPLGLDYDPGTKKSKCRTPSANFCTAYFLEKYQ